VRRENSTLSMPCRAWLLVALAVVAARNGLCPKSLPIWAARKGGG